MIPFITPKILANAEALAAEDLDFGNRAEEIEALPNYLSVYLTSPAGLSLVSVGTDTPDVRDRNKPWFYTGDPVGLFVWNTDDGDWQNMSPVDVVALLTKIQAARVTSFSTSGTNAWLSKQAADVAKQYAERAWTAADDAVADADNAEIDAVAVVGLYSVATSGFLSGDVGDNALAEITWPELSIFGERVNYSPGYVISDWYDLPSPFDTTKPIVGTLMLTGNNTPNTFFNYSCQVEAGGTRVRLWGYEIYPEDIMPLARRVCFNYLVKGVLL